MSHARITGVDIGGTHIKAALVEGDGMILKRSKIPTLATEGSVSVVGRLIEAITAVSEPERGSAIGLAVPGAIDMGREKIFLLPNIPGDWENIPVVDTLRERFHVPVFLINDVRAAAYGESRLGVGRGAKSMVFVSLGTGIGGGIVLDGKPFFGAEDSAGEIGHQVIDVDGEPCGCGNWGCVESLASGPAIASMAIKAIKQGQPTVITEIVNGDLNVVNPEVVAKAADQGDPLARRILEKAGFYIGTAIGNVITILNPNLVVLGGSVSESGPCLLDSIEKTVTRRVKMVRGGRGEVRIVKSHLGDDAGILGSALWALERLSNTQ